MTLEVGVLSLFDMLSETFQPWNEESKATGKHFSPRLLEFGRVGVFIKDCD